MALTSEGQRELGAKLSTLNTFAVTTLLILAAFAALIDQELREDEQQRERLTRIRRTAAISSEKAEAPLAKIRLAMYRGLSDAARYSEVDGEKPRSAPKLAPRLTPIERRTIDQGLRRDAFDTAKSRAAWASNVEEAEKMLATRAEEYPSYDPVLHILQDYRRAATALSERMEAAQSAKAELDKLLGQKQTIPSPFGEFEVQPRLALLSIAFAAVLAFLAFVIAEARILPREIGVGGASAEIGLPPWFYSRRRAVQHFFGWSRRERVFHFAVTVLLHAVWIAVALGVTLECFRWNAFGALLLRHSIIDGMKILLVLLDTAMVAITVAWLIIDTPSGQSPQVSRRRAVWLMTIATVPTVVVWMVALGVAADCFRWDAFAAFFLRHPMRTGLIALFLLLDAAMVAVMVAWLITDTASGRSLEVSRRKAIWLMTTGTAAAVVVWMVRSRERVPHPLPRILDIGNVGGGRALIANGRSFVVHHTEMCKDHLPKKKIRAHGHMPLHRTREAGILLGTAREHEGRIAWRQAMEFPSILRLLTNKTTQDEWNTKRKQIAVDQVTLAIAALRTAIDLHPLSVHLYDALASRYGRLKQYERIDALFDEGIQRVKAMTNARNATKINRVLNALEVRKRNRRRPRRKKQSSAAAVLSRFEGSARFSAPK